MRVRALVALVGLMAGLAGPCPWSARCAGDPRPTEHQCCCGGQGQCQCHLDARRAPRTPSTEALPAQARETGHDVLSLPVPVDGVIPDGAGRVAGIHGGAATASFQPHASLHLTSTVIRC